MHAAGAEVLAVEACLHGLDARLDQRPFGIAAGERHARFGDDRHRLGAAQAFGRGPAISADEAADAELGAAEPAGDDSDDTIEMLAIDGRQYRFAGAAGRLAVVIE